MSITQRYLAASVRTCKARGSHQSLRDDGVGMKEWTTRERRERRVEGVRYGGLFDFLPVKTPSHTRWMFVLLQYTVYKMPENIV